MKNLIIISFLLLLICVSWVSQRNVELVKKFSGGREMYSHSTLDLLNDSTYHFTEWYHSGGTGLDSGNWKLIDSLLILNSFNPDTISYRHKTSRKERKQLKSKEKYILKQHTTYRFVNDTFLYRDSIVYLFDFDELKDELDSSFCLLYLSLHEHKLK